MPTTLVLRKPPRKLAGRPTTTKQRLFDTKVKPFEKLCAAERDAVCLRWFVPDDVVGRTLLGGEGVQAAELRDNILSQACDARAAVDEIQSYFETAAWNAFLQWRDAFSDNGWNYSRCGSNTTASGTHRKWIQCNHCLAWIHFQCAALGNHVVIISVTNVSESQSMDVHCL